MLKREKKLFVVHVKKNGYPIYYLKIVGNVCTFIGITSYLLEQIGQKTTGYSQRDRI